MDCPTRVDLFISFHGSEQLRAGFTTRELARQTVKAVERKAQNNGKQPSVFFDEGGLRGAVNGILDAVLQTRGGGLALFLLTRDYFRRKWCLAELRAFLAVRGEHIKMGFICLDTDANSILKDPIIKNLVPELGDFPLPANLSIDSVEQASADLADIVSHAWTGLDGTSREVLPTILGKTREATFLALQHSFTKDEVPAMRSMFGIPFDGPSDVDDVFSYARDGRKIGYHNVTQLKNVITRRNGQSAAHQRRAVESYECKWIHSGRLQWGDGDLRQMLLRLPEKASADIEGFFGRGQSASESREVIRVSGSGQTASGNRGVVENGHRYVVRAGDTLWKIAEREYGRGDLYREIWDANKESILDADLVHLGMEIVIPERRPARFSP